MLRIKLFPTGKKHQRKYRIVVVEKRRKLEGNYLENLGWYDPLSEPETVVLDKDRYNQWIEKGAQPTRTVRNLAKHE